MKRTEIEAKLNELKKLDPECQVFGAKKHQYQLKDPIEESLVVGFEERYRIALPEEYRCFLLEVGNGGPGPCYGIFALDESEYELTGSWDEYEPPLDQYLTLPYDTPENLDACRLRDHTKPGMLAISDCGCMAYHFLCTAGEERGYIWSWSPANIWRPASKIDDEPKADEAAFEAWFNRMLAEREKIRVTFMEWYALWLEDSLRALKG